MRKKLIGLLVLSCTYSYTFAALHNTRISGFAHSFLLQTPIKNAKISILETGQTLYTNEKGEFGPFPYPAEKSITLVLNKFLYKEIQSATIIVPKNGLTTPYNNISFQVPSIITYYAFAAILGAKIDSQSCHVATTVSAFHKTLNDEPQGEAGAIITISPAVKAKPFYFDLFKSGFLKNKTNPFTKNLSVTSLDGGVVFFNLPPRHHPYILSAVKKGVKFTKASFICRKGEFINLSPPQGPTVINQSTFAISR